MMRHNYIILTGVIGLLASMMVGVGEGLLHYSSIGYGGALGPYDFMLPFSGTRLAYGHFIAILASPFYLVGYWHVYKMLSPASGKLGIFITLAAGYGFVIGSAWIASRAMIATIVQMGTQAGDQKILLITQYQFYMESLLQIIRITTLLFSFGFSYLVWKRVTLYPRWMILVNPFILLVVIFLSYAVLPTVGQFIMPIAMNVAHFVFFGASLGVAWKMRSYVSSS